MRWLSGVQTGRILSTLERKLLDLRVARKVVGELSGGRHDQS